MLAGMARPGFGSVLFGWIGAAAAAFVAMFEADATDDFAGWIPVMVAVQLPVFFALRRGAAGGHGCDHDHDHGHAADCPARHEVLPEPPLRGARRWAVALPAALAGAMGVFWTALAVGNLIWEPQFLELRPLMLATVAGFAAVIAAGVGFARILWRLPHPRGTRRVLLVVAALGAAGLAAVGLSFGQASRSIDPGAWLVVAVPILWVIPLWLLTAVEPPRDPAIPRAVVSR